MKFLIYIFLLYFLAVQNSYAGYDDAINYFNSKNYKKSIREFKKFIEINPDDLNKKSNAMFNLAVIYDYGLGTKEDKNKAIYWYKLASTNNHKIAQFNLAWMYYHGDKLEKNYFEAFKYYSLSAEQGYSKAQYNLGSLLFAGEGTLKDYVLAYKWFKISLLNGIKESKIYLNRIKALMHEEEVIRAEKQVEFWVKEYNK